MNQSAPTFLQPELNNGSPRLHSRSLPKPHMYSGTVAHEQGVQIAFVKAQLMPQFDPAHLLPVMLCIDRTMSRLCDVVSSRFLKSIEADIRRTFAVLKSRNLQSTHLGLPGESSTLVFRSTLSIWQPPQRMVGLLS